jgi:hypothetical protein
VDHDISLLIPEIWARLDPEHRDPQYLIAHGYLEPVEDFEHNGQQVLGSRLGYRITAHFVHGYFGKIFDNPTAVFTDEILKPETQSLEDYVDGINNIVEAQQGVAQRYLDDGSIDDACPPLQALLHIMATGSYEGKDIHHPDIRAMFTREYLLGSDWYRERLEVKQQRDIALWERHVLSLRRFLDDKGYVDEAERLGIAGRLETAKDRLQHVKDPAYLDELVGTLGADPLRPAHIEDSRGVLKWGKAKLARPVANVPAENIAAPMASASEVPSLLDRVREKFRRATIH